MTREEAIRWLEETIQDTDTYWNSCSEALQRELDEQKEVFLMALTALRPIRREQVEKAWRGEWIGSADGYADGELVYDTWTCSECGYVIDEEDDPDMLPQFCPKCYAAMTDEAVDMVMERLEMMKND